MDMSPRPRSIDSPFAIDLPSSAQRTRVSRAGPLPPSGDRSKAVMVIVIVKLLPTKNHRPRGWQAVKANSSRCAEGVLRARALSLGLPHRESAAVTISVL